MEKDKKARKRKPGKAQRDKIKAEKAQAFNFAFNVGYEVGYDQALKDLAKENEK